MKPNQDSNVQSKPQTQNKPRTSAPPEKTPQAPEPGEDKRGDGLALEGEGSYTASRNYREQVERSVHNGGLEDAAEAAAKALDGPEGEELRRAEQAAKQGKKLSQN